VGCTAVDHLVYGVSLRKKPEKSMISNF
jgi:hypothetical protein